MPFVNPVTVHVVAPEVEHVLLPGDAVTVYPVIAEPPFEAGAVHETAACALPRTPTTPLGASGTFAGVTAADAVDGELVPTAFVAVTRNV